MIPANNRLSNLKTNNCHGSAREVRETTTHPGAPNLRVTRHSRGKTGIGKNSIY